jgi:hypothetical protein
VFLATALAALAAVVPVGHVHADSIGFAGPGLILGESDQLRYVAPDGSSRVVFKVKTGRDLQPEIDSWDATADRLVVSQFGQTVGGEGGGDIIWSSVRAGPLFGPLELIAGSEKEKFGPAALDGPQDARLADGGVLLVEGRRRDIVWRADDGTRSLLAPSAGGVGISTGGHFAALFGASRVRVYDLTTRAVAYEFELPNVRSASVDAEGHVTATDDDSAIWVASPAAPTPTKVHDNVRDGYLVDENTLVYEAKLSSYLAQERIVDLSTGADRAITPALPSTPNGTPLVITDGTRLVYRDGLTECLYLGDVPAEEPALMPRGRGCGPLMYFDASDVLSQKRLPMTLACPGGPSDRCAGTVLMRRRIKKGPAKTLRRWTFSLAGGQQVDHRFTVPPHKRGRFWLQLKLSPETTMLSLTNRVELF